MNFREATRKTYVERIDIHNARKGEMFHLANLFPGDAPDEMWTAFITTRSGLLPPKVSIQIFLSEAEVDEFVENHPIGSEIDSARINDEGSLEANRKQIESIMDERPQMLGIADAGDDASPLAFNVLTSAGINRGIGLSQEVILFLGEKRVDFLIKKHDQNWECAAAFEYCWLNLDHSSPAYIAAAYRFHYYITGDDFSAGYLWRDLENLVHRVEATAIKANEMRKKAGEAGSEKSAMARNARRAALLVSIEAVAARNPDVVKLGHKAVATLALSDSAERDPVLWSQGRGQVQEYLGEIRRGEAGPELRDRFLSIFPTKPPKRSG